MILIEVHKPNGSLVGRCDARCYNARHPECDCICGGRNHGRGICGNTLTWVREAHKALKEECPENIVTSFGIQGGLFGN